MRNKIKYYYLFKPELNSHIQFYRGWTRAANDKGLDIRLISFVNIINYLRNYGVVSDLRKKNRAIIIPIPFFLRDVCMFLYFLFQCIFNKKVVIHLKKVNPKIFNILKKMIKNIFYIIDLEGYPEAEKDYLILHPYKDKFYDEIIKNLNSQIENYDKLLFNCDYIFTVTEALKQIVIDKHSQSRNKISVLPTGVDENKFFYDLKIRNTKREELKIKDKFVVIFVGNVFYSWQNLKRTLEVFKKIKKIKSNAYMVLLIKKSDLAIARDFINAVELSREDYLLTSVPNKEVNSFLNASDLGVLLRNNHLMNKVASPGKIGEYAVTGLPILSTRASTNFAEFLLKNNQMIMLENLENEGELIKKVSVFDFKNVNRKELQYKSKNKFTNKAYIDEYIKSIKKIGD